MASNRKLPFGYRIVCGEVVPHESEVETVRWIYDTYLTGAPYSTLVGALQERGVSYDVGKAWNKNMVARILEDRRYIGERDYPVILEKKLFEAVQAYRQERVVQQHQTPSQKELRRLCKGTPSAWVEGQVLGILNCLIQNPNMISYTKESVEETETEILQRKLDDAIHCPPVDEVRIRSMAVQLATLRLNAIGSEEYQTHRLRSLFRGRTPMVNLDQELLHESVRQITYTNGIVCILLKNQQLLKGGTVR